MTRIEISPYEQRDLIEYLKVAQKVLEIKRKKKGAEKWDNSKYHKMRIDRLIDLIEGNIDNSSLLLLSSCQKQRNAEKNSKEKIPMVDLPYIDY